MNAAKQQESGSRHALPGMSRVSDAMASPAGLALAGFLVLGLLLAGAGLAWSKWGTAATSEAGLRLTADAIEVTPPPEWIRSDVKAEVIRDGSLAELSVLDPQVALKVARAFKLHTWVADVDRVRKQYGPRVLVELRYRRPVAWVEVSPELVPPGGLLPVDAESVLLPTKDFSEEQAGDYLRIKMNGAAPAGPVGTPWGDQRVLGAAQIAAVFGERFWQQLGLYRIALSEEYRITSSADEPAYEIQTRNGSRLVWGHAPGDEVSGEPKATEKIARLVQFYKSAGSLENQPNSVRIDVSGRGGLTVRPTTASVPRDAQTR